MAQRWNVSRLLNDHGFPQVSASKARLSVEAARKYASGLVQESNRSFASAYTDIVVSFDDKVQDATLSASSLASGHTISINGIAWPTYYQSGSGTTTWTLRVLTAVSRSSALTYSYDPTHGNTTSVALGTALATVTNQPIQNKLSPHIRFNLLDSLGAVVASQTVKLAILQYGGGAVSNSAWMTSDMAITTTTDSSGVIDFVYTGAAKSGDTVYVGVIRPDSSPTESLIWNLTIE